MKPITTTILAIGITAAFTHAAEQPDDGVMPPSSQGKKLTDQAQLAKVLIEDGGASVRGASVKRLTDQALLAKLGVEAKDDGVRKAAAQKPNGNDFALFFSEARDDRERADLLEEARGRPRFFRYLQIMEMQNFEEGERSGVTIIAFEPASRMDVRLTVTQPVSLALLAGEPKSKRGDAIAVTGKVLNADAKKNMIELGDSIVRHKDRLRPKLGKELLCEVDPGAVFYNYTAGSRPVTLTYKDRDLIRHKERIIAEKGPDGWVEFLEQEVASRNKNRQPAKPGAE